MSRVNKILSVVLLAFFLGTMFFSLMHMSHMNMSSGMTDCPFMSHEEAICPMNLMDHVGAWKSVFLSTIPSLTLLLALAGAAVLVASVAPNLLQRVLYASPPLYGWIRTQTYICSHRPLQELFSKGILHPKLF